MKQRCSFCAIEKTPELEMVAGPSVFICSDCIRIASIAISEKKQNGKVHCSLCGKITELEKCLIHRNTGYLCSECVREIRQTTDHLIEK